MKKKKILGLGGGALLIVGGLLGLIAIIALALVGQYNTLVRLEEQVDNSQAQVESVLQRRYDLIPNLVESVRGSMAQEERIFTQIAEARTRYGNAASGTDEKIEAANEFEGAISRLLVVIENYPELRSSENVRALMDELAGTENRIAVERRRYNDDVRDYNTNLRSFPTNIVAGMFGFESRSYFEAVEAAQEAPTVSFE